MDNSTKLQKNDMLKGLVQFYENEQCSTFKNEEKVVPPLFTFSGNVDSSINYFLAGFEVRLTQLKKKKMRKNISIMIKEKKMMSNEIDSYRHHQFCCLMFTHEKLSLLITPSTSNVERFFSLKCNRHKAKKLIGCSIS